MYAARQALHLARRARHVEFGLEYNGTTANEEQDQNGTVTSRQSSISIVNVGNVRKHPLQSAMNEQPCLYRQ